MSIIRRFMCDETAATAIEYGLIAGVISIVIIMALNSIGMRLSSKFTRVSNGLS